MESVCNVSPVMAKILCVREYVFREVDEAQCLEKKCGGQGRSGMQRRYDVFLRGQWAADSRTCCHICHSMVQRTPKCKHGRWGRERNVLCGKHFFVRAGCRGAVVRLRGTGKRAAPPIGAGVLGRSSGGEGARGVPCGQCGALGTSRVRMPNSRHNAKRVTVCTVTLCRLAERERFELSIQVLPVYSLSRGAPSAARPPLRCRAARRARKRVYPVGGRAVKRVSHFRGAESVPGWRCHHSAPFVNGQPLHSLGRQTPFPLTNRKPSAISTARRQHAAGSRQPPVVSCGSRRCS